MIVAKEQTIKKAKRSDLNRTGHLAFLESAYLKALATTCRLRTSYQQQELLV